MQITLKQNIQKFIFRFIGEVSYRDDEKIESFKAIFKNAKNENELRESLRKENIPNPTISEFCRTLKKLHVMDEEGNIPNQLLIGEYGDYKVECIATERDTPYCWLPTKLERNIQDNPFGENCRKFNSTDFCNLFKNAQKLTATTAVGIIHKIDSPELAYVQSNDSINIDIDIENNRWLLKKQDNTFTFPDNEKINPKSLFNDNLIWENDIPYLEFPLKKAKEHGIDTIKNFICSFSEQISNDWGDFSAEYRNVNIVPRKEDVQSWYNEIFTQTLKISGYQSQADLKFRRIKNPCG